MAGIPLGLNLLPLIHNWHDLVCYRPDARPSCRAANCVHHSGIISMSPQATFTRPHDRRPGHVFARDDQGTAGSRVVTVSRQGTAAVTVPVNRAPAPGWRPGWDFGAGTAVSKVAVR
ncbi:hypothetical protein ACI2LC_38105 [Nonomuraea wenchangensis]|uniref:hypothetical protein n=1 Tax=Nonomuraea wenchangensis TaxID=568860 RepID=UPI00384EB3FF